MANQENPSNNNWLTLLRRKISKKFKRNRQKLESSSSLDDFLEEIQEERLNSNDDFEAPSSTATDPVDSLAVDNCEEMKKELFKLSWYWPRLTRIEAQNILKIHPNGSFLVRDSSEKDSFTLSFRTNSKTFHCRNQW